MNFLTSIVPTKLNLKLSPEVLILLPLAIMADVSGLILLCFGVDDFGVIDTVCDPILLIWILVRKKDPAIFNKILLRFLGVGAVEAVPYLGGIIPGYTILVIKTIMDTQDATIQKTVKLQEQNSSRNIAA